MASNSALSQTIQSLTLSKIRELENLRNTCQSRKSVILRSIAACDDWFDRLTYLLAGTKELHPGASKDVTVGHIERWLDKARYDSSIPSKIIEATPKAKDDSDDEDFLVVEERQKQRLQQLCDQSEAVVFEPRETNEQEIHAFLEDLFLEDEGKRALSKLRSSVKGRCKTIWTAEEPFNRISLSNFINGLLTQELLSDGKRAMLKDFLDNEVAMTEIADVLNMRYADLKNWDHEVDGGETDIKLTEEVSNALEKVESRIDYPVEDNELKWILQLYAQEPLRLLEGLSLVDKRFLPVGALAMVKGKRVTWQMVL
ncbi:hypothetical protein GB937_010444 [Aspergillus fischeri]|nr:hypothetical protein GB937_010444 [Aspergillus fischeri]